jgi:predicted DCC family thiol-disulfide oxidoreductase YuxK
MRPAAANVRGMNADSASLPPEIGGPVLLFDGECGLCQRVVRILLRLDRRARLRFAPLQGTAAQAFLRARGLPTADFESLVFVPDWSRRGDAPFFERTDGVRAALRAVGGAGTAAATALAIFPSSWRDAGYRCIARWRYRVFGQWRPHPLARPEWSQRFLD